MAAGVHRQSKPSTRRTGLRRELGLIVHDAKAVKKLSETFESDWVPAESKKQKSVPKEKKSDQQAADAQDKVEAVEQEQQEKAEKQTEAAVEVLKHELDPLATTVKKAVRKAVAKAGEGRSER